MINDLCVLCLYRTFIRPNKAVLAGQNRLTNMILK